MDPSPERPAGPVIDRLPAPVDLPALVRATWNLYRRNFWLWFLTALVVYGLLHAAQTIALETFLPPTVAGEARPAGEQAWQFVVGVLMVSLAGTFLSNALIPAMGAATLGEKLSFAGSLRRMRARSRQPLMLILYALFVGVAMILPPFGFLVLIVGSEILLAMVAGPPILAHAVVHEGVPARESWKRTRVLMRRQWLRVVMNMLTLALGLGIVQFLFLQGAIALADLIGISEGVGGTIYLAGVQSVFAALAMPLLFLAWWVSYLEVRSRNEDYDRADLENDVAQGAEPQPGLTGP